MTKKVRAPEREAGMLAKAEHGFEPEDLGEPVANPLRKVGRPSLSAGGGASRAVNTRVSSEVYDDLLALSQRTGRSVSEVVRDALRALVAADGDG